MTMRFGTSALHFFDMKKLILFIALFLPMPLFAIEALGDYDFIHNPWTGRLDIIQSTTTISGGYYSTICFDSDTCFTLSGNDLTLTVHGETRQTWTTVLADEYLLLDDGASFIVLDDGTSKIIK